MGLRSISSLQPVIVFLLIACGCTTTVEEQLNSFLPYENATIEGDSLRQFIESRKVTLVAGAQIDEVILEDGELRFIFGAETTQTVDEEGNRTLKIEPKIRKEGIGSTLAIPLGEPGYFLATAHGLTHSPFSLVYHYNDKVKHSSATVVWINEEVDIAILRSDIVDIPTFEIADEIVEGDAVFACTRATPSAGILISHQSVDVEGHVGGIAFEISHTVPMRYGDSGSAIVNSRGELIGVHSNTGFHLLKLRKTRNAFRLDAAFLSSVIAKHLSES